MASVGIGRRLSFESSRLPSEVSSALQAAVSTWTGSAIPSALRTTRVTGAAIRIRGTAFVLRLTRSRRVLAPLVCRGKIRAARPGSAIDVVIRPSRRWILVPMVGTILLAVAWQISAAPPSTTIRYALLVGVLWALNVGLAAIPVGYDPPAEHAAFIAMLKQAADGEGSMA